MKTMCPPVYRHNDFLATWAHDIRLHTVATNETNHSNTPNKQYYALYSLLGFLSTFWFIVTSNV